ncbi:MAG: hypothetical protein ACK5NN_12705 [Sphingomonadaceae bacterium]
MSSGLLYLSAALVLATCLTHSIVGERRLIRPLIQLRVGILQSDLARQVLRFAWHFTSGIGLIVVFVLFEAAQNAPSMNRSLVLLTGLVLSSAGIFDAFYTRGKHIGWPLLTAAGLTALAALFYPRN